LWLEYPDDTGDDMHYDELEPAEAEEALGRRLEVYRGVRKGDYGCAGLGVPRPCGVWQGFCRNCG
jgi:hypothetical protein